MLKVMQAKCLMPGMVMAFSNPRQNFLIDDVEWDRDGDIKVHHGNFTAVDWYEAESNVWVQLED